MLSYFASCIAQGGYKGSLREIYVLIAGDFQELSSRMAHTCCSKNPHLIPEIKIKSRLEILTHDVSVIRYEMHYFHYPFACGCI